MKKMIIAAIILLICVLVLISSIIQAESINHNFWWQVIGMAIVTFFVGRVNVDLFHNLKIDHLK
ncbi:hypothetical protein [Lactobacillus apis]|uniref:hypothetical protein n=1 Tax=Lactobacillus apis TaxID=303541 RepID=UPI002432BA74|nr:hypothetical protein [Lactobacillus apis]